MWCFFGVWVLGCLMDLASAFKSRSPSSGAAASPPLSGHGSSATRAPPSLLPPACPARLLTTRARVSASPAGSRLSPGLRGSAAPLDDETGEATSFDSAAPRAFRRSHSSGPSERYGTNLAPQVGALPRQGPQDMRGGLRVPFLHAAIADREGRGRAGEEQGLDLIKQRSDLREIFLETVTRLFAVARSTGGVTVATFSIEYSLGRYQLDRGDRFHEPFHGAKPFPLHPTATVVIAKGRNALTATVAIGRCCGVGSGGTKFVRQQPCGLKCIFMVTRFRRLGGSRPSAPLLSYLYRRIETWRGTWCVDVTTEPKQACFVCVAHDMGNAHGLRQHTRGSGLGPGTGGAALEALLPKRLASLCLSFAGADVLSCENRHFDPARHVPNGKQWHGDGLALWQGPLSGGPFLWRGAVWPTIALTRAAPATLVAGGWGGGGGLGAYLQL